MVTLKNYDCQIKFANKNFEQFLVTYLARTQADSLINIQSQTLSIGFITSSPLSINRQKLMFYMPFI